MANRKKTPQTGEKAPQPEPVPAAAAEKARPDDFPVIGVGASAGGLEAFGKFFSAMPTNTGMAFILVQHLDPNHTSNMVDLLRRLTRIPVDEARDGLAIEPDHVYMIPPNRSMTVTNHTLRLMLQLEHPGIMHSIDLFFRSLATDLKERAICIILSGTGMDGTLGAKAVKAEGGMVIVQDPSDAAYDGMPRAAIAAGVADIVLPAKEMAEELGEYIKTTYGKQGLRAKAVEKDSNGITQILTLIRARTRHDFSGYKQSTITRRIERRMGINRIDSIDRYLKYLREHPAEVEALVKDFLINVTSFFRDPEAFTSLKDILKKNLADKPEGLEIRAWVPGCSTGEEAYSIAVILDEAVEELDRGFVLQVFATDLDPDAIQTARTGIYPASILADVGENRIKKYFVKLDDQFQVKRELREKLVFAVQDVISDPPFTRMDLISARNLLIYFDADLQRRLIPMFHYALNPGGVLFLGTAETVGEFTELFTSLDRTWKIYQTLPREKRLPYALPERLNWQEPGEIAIPRDFTISHPNVSTRSPEQVMLEALPAAALIDSNFQIVYTHGDTRRYLGFPEGQPSASILDVVHPEIRASLATAIQQANKEKKEVVREGIRVKLNGNYHPIRLVVTPVPPRPGEAPGRMVVTFYDLPEVPAKAGKNKNEGDGKVAELEHELQFTKETLRSTIEELETANEELRSANEEYQSTNEELQSTNEELETSREELQSVNEELSTVNTEHQAKIEELSTINDDMRNLLNSTGIATIYLSDELRIKRFTPAAATIFNIIASDVDRPISHITSKIENYDIENKAKNVLDTLIPTQDTVQAKDGKWYSLRILPYRTSENAIAGVVVTLVDISDQKRVEEELARSRQKLDDIGKERAKELAMSEKRFTAFIDVSPDTVYRMNPDWSEMLQLNDRALLANSHKPNPDWLNDYIPKDEQPRVLHAVKEAVTHKTSFELEYGVYRRDGTTGWVISRAVPLLDEKGNIVEWFGVASDITARKKLEEEKK